MPMTLSADQLVEVLRAAGEPTRLRVLALLAAEELAVMELGRILGQSQPRVSRHLRLLVEAGLVERFPDGAWVFYRLAADGPARALVGEVLSKLDGGDPELGRDAHRLEAVRAERAAAAADYFSRNAAQWDELRSLHVDEAEVEGAIARAAGTGRFRRLLDLGTGTGRMLALLAPRADEALGLDLSQQMLNVARAHAPGGGGRCALRHGDITATGLPDGWADLVVIHRVLHYLPDPGAAVGEAARVLAPGGRLLIVDFAPHALEHLREQHQHRRLGFSHDEIGRWLEGAGLAGEAPVVLPSARADGLTVVVWAASAARLRAPTPVQLSTAA
jgi:ubiquinone/menaquinone biosynthesis C-methylase UbiE/DNA-binding transcriptional ArsR family regulator